MAIVVVLNFGNDCMIQEVLASSIVEGNFVGKMAMKRNPNIKNFYLENIN